MTLAFIPNPFLLQELLHDAGFDAGMQEAAEAALADAQAHVPVETGELRDSLHIEDGADGAKLIVAGTDHWLFPEFGTVYMEPTPYLRPAITDVGLKLG